jgi:hypothetical protein
MVFREMAKELGFNTREGQVIHLATAPRQALMPTQPLVQWVTCITYLGVRSVKWRWGRFSPSTSVSPANLHPTSCSTITLTYHLGLVQ